jgi:hypothetical protein
MVSTSKAKIEGKCVVLFLIAGVILSLFQFLYNRSLWIDEAWLGLNIIHKNSFELLKPLDYNQVAPILFLQIEKLFSIFIPVEYGLRIFPLLCFWSFLYFFYKILKMLWKDNYCAIIIALSFAVFNPLFILYSSEVKQYIVDVFVLSVVFYFTIKDYKKVQNKYYILAIVGVLSIFLSNVAPIILFTSGLYLFYDNFFVTKNKKILSLSLMSLVWLVAFSVYYCFFIYEHPAREFMIAYWYKAGGFLPHSFDVSMFERFVIQLGSIFLFSNYALFMSDIWDASIPGLIMYFIMVLFFLIGIVKLIRYRKMKIIILTCVPFLLHVFLSAFYLYPVSTRAMLYTLPCMIVICAEGFNFMEIFFRLKSYQKKRAVTIICILLLFCGLYRFPIKKTEIKDCLKYINEHIKEDEAIYAYSYAIPSLQYYTDIEYINSKFISHTQDNIFDGEYWNKEKYTDILKELRGRYWLMFSLNPGDETYIINQLNSLGHKKIEKFQVEGFSIYLYDFDK